MHTEEEARKLWCPMVRKSHYSSSVNVEGSNRAPVECSCIASRCAMWRWGVSPAESERRKVSNLGYVPDALVPRGFCGLAGRPTP